MDDYDIYKDIGLKLKAFRKLRGITLQDLALRLNKSIATLSKYESGDVAISLDVLVDLCRILDIDLSSLLPSTISYSEESEVARYSSFFEDKLFLYWYNGEQKRMRCALIINDRSNRLQSTMYYDVDDSRSIDEATYIYSGNMNYSDTGTVFLFTNIEPPFDKLVIRIPSFTRKAPRRIGVMLALTLYYQNVAVKIIASASPVKDKDSLIPELKLTKEELQEIRRSNFMII